MHIIGRRMDWETWRGELVDMESYSRDVRVCGEMKRGHGSAGELPPLCNVPQVPLKNIL